MPSEILTIPGEPTEVERSFYDRWFSWPWCPWKKTRTYTPRLPDPRLYKMSDTLDGECIAGHPETLLALVTLVNAREEDARSVLVLVFKEKEAAVYSSNIRKDVIEAISGLLGPQH